MCDVTYYHRYTFFDPSIPDLSSFGAHLRFSVLRLLYAAKTSISDTVTDRRALKVLHAYIC